MVQVENGPDSVISMSDDAVSKCDLKKTSAERKQIKSMEAKRKYFMKRNKNFCFSKDENEASSDCMFELLSNRSP